MVPASLKWELLFACHLKILWQTRQVPGTGSSLISALLPPWLPPLSPIFFVLCRFPEANLWMSSWALTSEQAFLLFLLAAALPLADYPAVSFIFVFVFVFYICPLTYKTKIQMQTSWVGRSTKHHWTLHWIRVSIAHWASSISTDENPHWKDEQPIWVIWYLQQQLPLKAGPVIL